MHLRHLFALPVLLALAASATGQPHRPPLHPSPQLPAPSPTDTLHAAADATTAPGGIDDFMRGRMLLGATALPVAEGRLLGGVRTLLPTLVGVQLSGGIGGGVTVETTFIVPTLAVVFGPAVAVGISPKLTLVERPGLAFAVGADLSAATASGLEDPAGRFVPFAVATLGSRQATVNVQVARGHTGYRERPFFVNVGAALHIAPRTSVLVEGLRLGLERSETTLAAGLRHRMRRGQIEVGAGAVRTRYGTTAAGHLSYVRSLAH